MGHTLQIEFKERAKIRQQKGRRPSSATRSSRRKNQKSNESRTYRTNREDISHEVFIQPVVITVKKDGRVKIALDARLLNNAILKEKHQMPNLV